MGAADRRRRRAKLIKKFRGKCALCGSTSDLTIDHKIPKARGGTNNLNNLQLLCEPCNRWKADS